MTPISGKSINVSVCVYYSICLSVYVIKRTLVDTKPNKKYSENADTSTFINLNLELWLRLSVKLKKAYVITCRCLLVYCSLVPDMMSVGVIVYEICSFFFTFSCDFQRLSRSLSLINHKMYLKLLYNGTKNKVYPLKGYQTIKHLPNDFFRFVCSLG